MRPNAKTRVLSFVLALVMLLPLISIPTFAEAKTDGKSSFLQDFENTSFENTVTKDANTSYSAKLTEATKSSNVHGNALRMDVAPADRDGIYVIKYAKSANCWKFDLTEEQYQAAMAAGTISGTATGIGGTSGKITVNAAQEINTGSNYSQFTTFTQNNTTYAIVTGDAYKAADAQYGGVGGNVMAPVDIKHGTLSGDGDYLVIEFDLYLSPDFVASKGIQGRLQSTSNSQYFELFKITRGTTGNATLLQRDNSSLTEGSTKALEVGVWHTLTMTIDRTTGVMTMYADGVYAFKSASNGIAPLISGGTATLPLNFKANTLNIEVSRLTSIANLGGYIEVDNVSIEMVDEKTFITDITAQYMPGAWVVADETKGEAIEIPMSPDTSDVKMSDYYLMRYGDGNTIHKAFDIDGTSFILNDDGTISSTVAVYKDFDGNEIKLDHAAINGDYFKTKAFTATYDNKGASASGDFYVLTPEFHEAYRGNSRYNKPIKFYHGELNGEGAFWTASFDLYLSSDFKNNQGFTSRAQFKNDAGGAVNAELFKLYTTTSGEARLTVHNNANKNHSNADAGKLNYGRDDGERVLEREKWYRIDIVIQRDTTEQFVFVNGEFAFRGLSTTMTSSVTLSSNNGFSFTPLVPTPMVCVENSFQMERSRLTSPSAQNGALRLANVSISLNDSLPAGTYLDYDFEGVVVSSGNARAYDHGMARNPNSAHPWDLPSVTDAYGSRVYRRKSTGEDKAVYLPLPKISYQDETLKTFVYEMDYFIEAGAKGRIQAQFESYSADLADGTRKTDGKWLDLYRLQFLGGDGKGTLNFEGVNSKGHSYAFATGRWINVACVIDMVSGTYAIYVDGNLIFDDLKLAFDSNPDASVVEWSYLTNLTVDSESITVGKTNTVSGYSGAGYFAMDNIRVIPGSTPTAVKNGEIDDLNAHDFEEFAYSVGKHTGAISLPATATIAKQGDNHVLRLDTAPSLSADGYALLQNDGGAILAGTFEWDGESTTALLDGNEIELTKNEKEFYEYTTGGKTYYAVNAAVAGASAGDGNVTISARIGHGAYSYVDYDKIMLEADFFFEKGSTGVMEAQFENFYYGEAQTKGIYLNLYEINLGSGQVNKGLYMNADEWNSLQVVLDLDSGKVDVYVNGVYSHSSQAMDNNKTVATQITVGAASGHEWAVAKLKRQKKVNATPYAGELLVDNVSIGATLPESSEILGNKFLSNEAFTEYAADALMEVENGASIRMNSPTGLRFATLVDEAAIKRDLLSRLPEGSTVEIVRQGTLLAPESYYAYAGDKLTHADLDEALAEVVPEGQRYLDIGFDDTYYSGYADLGLPKGDYMVGSVVNIKQANIGRAYAAAGYIELNVNGESFMLYTDVVIRSPQGVAQLYYNAYVNGDVELSEDELNVLKSFNITVD